MRSGGSYCVDEIDIGEFDIAEIDIGEVDIGEIDSERVGVPPRPSLAESVARHKAQLAAKTGYPESAFRISVFFIPPHARRAK